MVETVTPPVRVLGIGGSTRTGSKSRVALRAAVNCRSRRRDHRARRSARTRFANVQRRPVMGGVSRVGSLADRRDTRAPMP